MKVLIAEDERVPARRLERKITEILGDRLQSMVLKETLQEAEAYLLDKPIDLLFLDLNLNGQDGYDLLKMAAAGAFKTIVVSANTDRAIDAFQYGVVDFVGKPYDLDRLKTALARVESQARSQVPAKYLSVRKFGKVELIPIDKVLYFQGAGDYVEIHLTDGRVELHSKTLETLETMLPSHFERIHKSYLADLREMKRIRLQGAGKYELETGNGTLLPISRTKYKELKERFNPRESDADGRSRVQ